MPFALTAQSKSQSAVSRKRAAKKGAPTRSVVESLPGLRGRSAIAPTIQAKLKIGEPNDKFEQEADRVADEVMRMPDSEVRGSSVDSATSGALPNIQRLCSQCGEKSQQRLFRNSDDDELGNNNKGNQFLQRKQGVTQSSAAVKPDIESHIHTLQAAGQPLSASSKAFFETRFGRDFSQVRVHTDSKSAQLARSVSAHAFTVGRHIVFGEGQYSPGSSSGRHLLAHELTHTLQQKGNIQAFSEKSPANEVMSVQSKLQRLGDLSKVPPGLACPVANSSPASTIRNVLFGVSVSALSPTQKSEVEQVAQSWHAAGSNPIIRIDGYASTDGSDPLNWDLSCRRALAVRDELVSPSSGTTPGIPATNIEVFAQGETNEFGAALPLNRRATISTTSPLPVPICTHPGVSRILDLQPIFFRSSVLDFFSTGRSWRGRFNEANQIWGKVGVTLNEQSPITLISPLKTMGSTLVERNSIRALRTATGAEVFMMDNDLTDAGGGATTGSGSAAAKIVLSDRGTSNTLLAHEVGHVLGLNHPPVNADPNTIMEPSSSHSALNPTRNTVGNFNNIAFPAPSGSTCILPDP